MAARQPTDLVVLKGRKHLSRAEEEERRAHEVSAPKPTQIRCPKWLPDDLRGDYRKYAEQLIALGIFSDLDRETLGRYLSAQKLWEDCTAQVMRYVQRGDSEGAADWTAIQDKYFKQARNCANDLGLTISSRCKLVVPKVEKPPEADPLEELRRRFQA